jgi:hypothetical protein
MGESIKLLYKHILHPEIYNSSLSLDQMLFLQDLLDKKHNGDVLLLLQDMLEYAILPDVEEYENAVIIRDYIKEIKDIK